jgi:hypothetical protein
MSARRLPGPLGLALVLALASPSAAGDDLARYDASIKTSARKHWAFQPVRPVAVPAVKDGAWVRNPIDTFVRAPLESRGWQPAPPAGRLALLRRAYLDVIGLPPTPQEQDAWQRDDSPDAWERLVERLLASPHYGERWGRHWLDLVRYADTNGYERDSDKPQVYRYRDYVIRSLNADKPYDRFVQEQLAGDELSDATAETVLATGFLRLGPWDDEPADPAVDPFDQLDDMVAATSQVFLGLTLACARCHNHKFEPLTQHDYYRMVAVFRPLRRPVNGRLELDLPAAPRGQRHADAPRGYFLDEASPQAPPTHLLYRGQPTRTGPEVAPGVPAVLVGRQPDFLAAGAFTTRRRLSLARWITAADNPLTARVLVNRVWQYHFGEGLVRTSGDFGRQGERPTHPELLDWLVGWFVREGYSLKKLHRLILTSNTYRMSKRGPAEYARLDPEDRLLAHFPYRRLEAEAIRDSMLAASGRLDRRLYGPTVRPPIPRAALESHSDPDKVWKASGEREASRRTVYVHLKRSLVLPWLEVLDFCDTTRPAPRRGVTTVAPQALTLYNGEFVNRQAHHLAARLLAEAGADPARQVELAWRLTLCRPPTAPERAEVLDFLRRQAAAGTPAADTLTQACRVVLNLNEFVYPD